MHASMLLHQTITPVINRTSYCLVSTSMYMHTFHASIEAHSDSVNSIQWAPSGLRFVSGSNDGTALMWIYETGGQHSSK